MTQRKSELGFDTLAVRAGQVRTSEGEQSEPIFPTSSFVFESARQAAARFSGDEAGNIYSRFTNPTVRTFEERLAALESVECCVATASGMAAILTTCMGLLKSGDHIVCSESVFGTTVVLFETLLSRFGLKTTFVPLTNMQAWSEAVRRDTRLLFLETPSNPLTEVADIRKLADLAHDNGALLVVDNCLCTPALQRPVELGADLIIHSATKYLDGQGRCVGGAVLGSRDLVGGDLFGFLRSAGPTMSPFNAWVFLKGLETLSLRMKAHSANALALARWLEEQPAVQRVYYPGLVSHPQHELASRQQSDFGGIVAFDVAGGRDSAWRIVDSTRLLSITANLGDVKSTITHPATTTHGRMRPEARESAGIGEGLLRVAVGMEDVKDLQADLEHGLEQLSGA
ncbi:MAG: O-succinylhomoserine sulfhydrylase [Gammaproteobacteria bacterium]|nr:O-succinylhomoserine sulfhydrylase [Gammaproteobacteria bacterium]